MGGYFSKIGSDPYYANYEKSFQRLKKDTDRLSVQTETRLKTRKGVAHFIAVWSTALFIFIVLFAAWVLRQPEGTYTPQEHALRVSPILIEPVSAYSLHCIIQWLLKIRDKRLTRRLKSLDTKMKRMIHDLKDSTRYDKTQKLLEKYDPEYVPSSPSRGFSNSTHFAPPTTPGLRHRQMSNMQAQSNPGMMSPLAGLQRGVGAAGSRVVPLLSSLAGMVGDNPALIEGLKTAQSEAEKLRSQVEKLQHENRMLRMRLGEDAPKQEPVTPRSGPSGIEAFSDKMGDNSAEAHQQLAGSSDEPMTPSKGSIDSHDSRTGQQQTDPAITSIDNADSHREEKTVRKRKNRLCNHPSGLSRCMSLFLQRPTSSAVRAVSLDLCAQRHDCLARFQQLLQDLTQSGENTDRHTLRVWLISAASKLEEVQPSSTWGRLEPLLRTGNDSRDTNPAFGIYLLQLVCDVERTKVGRLLAHHPRIIRHFFRDHPQHITTWFQSSYVGSISEFRNGAKALAQYALLHRAEMWDLLVWQGKHPQAPVAVAAKPYYFSELNIHQSMLNILKHHPQFFTSHQMVDTVKSGDILALDQNHFCEELYDLLVDDAEDLLDVIKGATMQQPFQLICQRLLHHLDDHQLLDFLSGILGQSHSQHQLQQLVSANSFGPISSPGGRAAWVTSQLEQCLQLIIFGCIRWRDLGSLTTHAALAFRFQQLHTSWQGSGKLQDIYNAAQLICSAEAAAAHWALLKSNARHSISTMYQDMLHSLWAGQCTIQHWSSKSAEQQILFLADTGIHATMLSSRQHSILRPSKKRKSHKHKRRKSHKKSRKSREMLPSSGEESLSDNDLGIMTPDASDRMPQAAGNWLLHMGRPESSQVQTSAQGLPAVLLHQALSGWTEYCYTLL